MRQRLSLIFLVLLRMAIGWHFLFEALEKHDSIVVWGATETRRPWTSESYFRESHGPVAALVRLKIGDLDDLALKKLTVRDIPPGEDPAKRLPAALDSEWEDYLARFAAHYGLDPAQRNAARQNLQREKEKTAVWFTAHVPSIPWLLAGLWSDVDRKPFKRSYASGTIEVNDTVSERAAEYGAKLQEYRSLVKDKPGAMGKDVDKARRTALRGELLALRTELLTLVDNRTKEMKQSLADVLTDEQTKKGPVPEPSGRWTFIWVVDHMTRRTLAAIGACLLLGLFSRLSAFSGAIFLLLTVLTTPSVPWLPAPPISEGNYFFVSKNVIEMLALFMLACIPSGRWFGVDALIHALNPWRKDEPQEF